MKTKTVLLDYGNLSNFFGSYQTFLLSFDKFLEKKGFVLSSFDKYIQIHDPKRETVVKTQSFKVKEIPVYKDRVVVKDTNVMSLEQLRMEQEALLKAYREAYKEMPPKVIYKDKIVEKPRYYRLPPLQNNIGTGGNYYQIKKLEEKVDRMMEKLGGDDE